VPQTHRRSAAAVLPHDRDQNLSATRPGRRSASRARPDLHRFSGTYSSMANARQTLASPSGPGARYHSGAAASAPKLRSRLPAVFDHLARTLGDIFPAARDVSPLGWPTPACRATGMRAAFDAATGIATAGGYVGDGSAPPIRRAHASPGPPSCGVQRFAAAVGESPFAPVGPGAAAFHRGELGFDDEHRRSPVMAGHARLPPG
jgi:hypothetical protein